MVNFILKILRDDKIKVIKIYSQGIHYKRLNNYSNFFAKTIKIMYHLLSKKRILKLMN